MAKRAPVSADGTTLSEVLNEGGMAPLYYLYGDEDFLLEEATKELVDRLMADGDRGFNLDILDGEDAETRDVVALASTYPMLTDRRVVVVRNPEKLDAELLDPYLENPAATTTMVLVSRKPDRRRSIHKRLLSTAKSLEFRKPYDNQLPGWVRSRAAMEGYSIDTEAATLLADSAGGSLRELHNELLKLYSYIGDERTIAAEHVEAVSGVTREHNTFELRHALSRREVERSLVILDRMIDAGQSAIYLNVITGRFFFDLYRFVDGTGKGVPDSAPGLPPFVLRDLREGAGRYSRQEIENAILAIARADELLKSTSMSHKSLLQFMAAAILSGDGNTDGL